MEDGMRTKKKKRETLLLRNHQARVSVCEKVEAAGVFGRGEMKISYRYLSPEKYQPRPYFAGHKSINEERTEPLPKKMCGVRAVIVYRFTCIRLHVT